MQALISFATPRGLNEIHTLLSVAWTYCLVLGARIWRQLYTVLTDWPFSLKDLGSYVEAERESCADRPNSAKECCLDAHVSLKVRYWRGSARRLVRRGRTMSIFRVWRRCGRFTNIHSERGFASVRRAAPPKADVARVLGGGYWADIQHSHLQAGGHDARKILRKDQKPNKAPIRANVKRLSSLKRDDRVAKQSMPFQVWFNARIKQC